MNSAGGRVVETRRMFHAACAASHQPARSPTRASRTGKLLYTNSFYYIGHFSKFIRPGARRIVAAPSRSMFLATAFVNPDGKVVVVVMNPTAQQGQYNIVVGAASVAINSRPHSIQTVVF